MVGLIDAQRDLQGDCMLLLVGSKAVGVVKFDHTAVGLLDFREGRTYRQLKIGIVLPLLIQRPMGMLPMLMSLIAMVAMLLTMPMLASALAKKPFIFLVDMLPFALGKLAGALGKTAALLQLLGQHGTKDIFYSLCYHRRVFLMGSVHLQPAEACARLP